MNVPRIGYYALALSCLVASCKDDVQDEEKPTVSITSPAANAKHWLEVTAAAEVMDNQGISKVEFYLDDELLGEDTEAPYELKFNSKEYKDGPHTLRTVAYDAADNQSEAEQQVEIFNKLLQVSVADNRFDTDDDWGNEKQWLVVANKEGEVIESAQLENGKEISVIRPDDLDDDKINVLLITKANYGSEYIFVDEYQGMSPDVWMFKGYEEFVERDNLGIATLNFSAPTNRRREVATHNIAYTSQSSVDNGDGTTLMSYELAVERTPAHAFVTIQDYNNEVVPTYSWMPDLQVDQQYDLTSEDFSPMDVWQSIEIASVNNYSLETRGATEDNTYKINYSYDSQFDPGNFNVNAYVPNELFDEYQYYLRFSDEQTQFTKVAQEKPLARYELPQVNVQVSNSNQNAFEASVDYSSDYTVNTWRYSDYSATLSQHIYWDTFTEVTDGKIQAKSVKVPSEILDQCPLLKDHRDELSYDRTEFMDREGISSLDEYVQSVYGTKELLGFFERITKFSGSENARKAAQEQTPPEHQKVMERYGQPW